MYNVSFKDIAKKLLPVRLRKPKLISFLFSALHPLKKVNLDFSVFRKRINYKLQFSAQVIYLEHLLNDKFDPAERRIYIEDAANISYSYLFNKIEARPPVYMYNNYSSATSYIIGEFAAVPIPSEGTRVYKAIANVVGSYPPTNPDKWVLFKENMYAYNNSEYEDNIDYIIHFPAGVYNEIIIRQEVDVYNLAGKQYLIQIS